MKTSIITIGNSKGVRLPKSVLALSGLHSRVELQVKRGEIKIVAAKDDATDAFASASETAFSKDWNRPEEDEAWAKYQSAK